MIILDFSLSKKEILNTVSNFNSNWSKDILLFLNEWWNDSDFITAKTSGSTGAPKTIILEKTKVINSARLTGSFFDFQEGNNSLLCMSPKYIAGKLMIVRAIVWKMNLICIEPDSNPLKSIPADTHIDFAAMVPLQVQNSISEINSDRVSKLIIGGGAIDNYLLKEIINLDTEIYSTYGMTETITHIALKKLNGDNPDNSFKALDNVVFSHDNRNCLVIHAKSVSDDDVITNDIIELIDSKTFNWLGRFDNVINSGGLKIFPEKIETILSKVISYPFFISSIKDEKLGEKVVLFIEGDNYKIDLDYLKEILPKYHSPKEVYFLNNFLRTDTGKVKRGETMDLIIIPKIQ